MTSEQRARIVAEGAALAAEIMPPLSDEQADSLALLLSVAPSPVVAVTRKRAPARRAA